MSDPQNLFKDKEGPFTPKLLPPEIPSHCVSVGGYEIPNIRIVPIEGSESLFNIVLDGRFGIMADIEEIKRWLWFLAQAMATAAGYTSFGENSNLNNPFKRQIIEITGVNE